MPTVHTMESARDCYNVGAVICLDSDVLLLRAQNSYSIERRLMDYVPTATLWSCYGRVPSQCKSSRLKQSELKLSL
jgi:hypothetical protein